MNLTEAIKKISEKHENSNLEISRKVIYSRDIDGGLNFEDTTRSIVLNNRKWLMRTVVEKTVQPPTGTTITSTEDSSEREFDDVQFVKFLQENKLTVVELRNLLNVLIRELNISTF